MEPKLKRLESIADLANERSSERRRELLREITDLFLEHPDAYSDRENWYFGDIMDTIAYDLEAKVRLELAERLSGEQSAPPDLIRKLANDEISVAKPVIENSKVLTQDDLVEIAKVQGQDHLLAMTRRDDISEDVSDVLVTRGNEEVVVGLVQNKTAAISSASYQKAADRAREMKSEGIQSSLAKRPDVPNEIMKEVLGELTTEIRDKILAESSEVDRGRLDGLLQEITESQEREIDANQTEESAPEMIVGQLEKEGKLSAGTLIQFAYDRKMPEFVCALSRLAKIDMATARRVAMDRTGEGLALTCRAGDMPTRQFSELIEAFGPLIQRSPSEMDELIKTYDRVAVTTAQRIIRFWNIRKSTMNDAA